MDNMLGANARKRIIKFAVLGFLIGTLLLGSYLTPILISRETEKKASSIQEENLVPSGGEAFGSFPMAEVAVNILLNGNHHDGMSVSANSEKWVTPQNGLASLKVAPNRYDFIAGYENRRVILSSQVHSNQINKIVLDVGNAPSAPDFQIFDLSSEEMQLLPLGIINADEVISKFQPSVVSITRKDGKFVLQVDKKQLPYGFSTLSLIGKNHSGEVSCFIGLRNPRNKTVVEIYTVDDLDNIRSDLSGSYLLKSDLDMSKIDKWIPIGTLANPFIGVFDGGHCEMTGFHSPEKIAEGESFALFGGIKNAELRNIVFREPIVTPQVPDREVGNSFTSSVLVANSQQSLIENCGSFGGIMAPSDNSTGGLIGGVNRSILRDLYSSTDVVCAMENKFLPNTGGVVAAAIDSYVTGCHNAGSVSGNHLTGGVIGYANASTIKNCLNSGYIWGSTIVGAIPAGGVLQTNDNGFVGYSYFVRGLAGVGATCPGGLVCAIIPIEPSDLLIAENLAYLGTFTGESPQWGYASLDGVGPIPYEIFKEKAPPPIVIPKEGKLTVAPVEGVYYFYSVDGNNPYTSGAQPVGQIDITLKQGQTLNIFAAKQGHLDSEIVTIAAQGGN